LFAEYYAYSALQKFLLGLKTTKFVQLMLAKSLKWLNSCHTSRLKCNQFDFSWGSAPDHAAGARSPRPLAGFKGHTSKGRVGRRGKGRKGKEGGRLRERMEEERKGERRGKPIPKLGSL